MDAGTLNHQGRTRRTRKTRKARERTRIKRTRRTKPRRIVQTNQKGKWRAETSEHPNICSLMYEICGENCHRQAVQ